MSDSVAHDAARRAFRGDGARRGKPSSVSSPAVPHPRLHERIATRLVTEHLGRWRSADLRLTLPDGTIRRLGNPRAGRKLELEVFEWSFFWRALTAADTGVGESYMDGDWRVNDLVGLCAAFLPDQSALPGRTRWSWGERLQQAWLRFSRRNTRGGSRRNIQRHYDLGNDFFRLFLDESMLYSCAIFETPGASLAEAQQAKLERIARRAGLEPGMDVLEIGCGWGAFAIHAAARHGCRVTAVTISKEQEALARRRAEAAGVAGRVDVRLCDYRELSGRFDRIVSIEMFEAVGYEYYDRFFRKCGEMLRPGGRMLLQTITVPDERFHAYRKGFDWIRKYIFPGGLLPSIGEIRRACRRSSDLTVIAAHEIGPHYARTLRTWRERFFEHLPEVRKLGFDDRFIRMWEFYLASCEAAFSVGHCDDLQIELAHEANGRSR